MSNLYSQQHDSSDETENDSVWDELSDQQTYEIQQHQDRHAYQPPNPNFTEQTRQIQQAVTSTANRIASAAKTVAHSAQQRVNRNGLWQHDDASDSVSEGNDMSYDGPYANKSSKKAQLGLGLGLGFGNLNREYSNRREHSEQNSPYADFGLRESASSLFKSSVQYGNNYFSSQDASDQSARLLDHNYGMDAELGLNGSATTENSNSNGFAPEKKFVFLEKIRIKRDNWGTVANLDLFLSSLYNYYYHRGLVPIIGKGIVELISLFFTLWLSVFLMVYLDWYGLWECQDETTCRPFLSNYILENPLMQLTFWNFLMMLYILLLSAYGLFSISKFVSNIKDALEAKYIFEDKLGISARKLEGGAVEWYEIIQKLLQLQQTGEYKFAINGQNIKDELVVAQRILRRENFMIAFFNLDLLDLTIPMPWKNGARSKQKFYSKSLEWSIYFCVLSYMFSHNYKIRPAFCMDAVALQRRFIFCGIAHAIFMPFLLFFMTLHFFLQNLYDFRTTKQYLGPREWSDIAKWKFREFNEYPHIFERRLEPSYQAAEDYLKLFTPSSMLNSVGQIMVFLSGSLGAVCVALAAMNDAILLHVKIKNWNLLWYVGILGVLYSVGKSLLPDNNSYLKYHKNLFAEMDDSLVRVSNHTHYYPQFWKKRGWDEIIKSAFSDLFQYKVKLFVLEIISIILAPIILCYSLPPCAFSICSFVQNTKMEVSGTGDHCGFACFDFDLFEDENWQGADEIPSSPNRISDFYANFNSQRRPKTKMGKMEKSFFNFKTQNPGWRCASSGQNLVDRVQDYQNEKANALARERQHHIAAAARQIAMLSELENSRQDIRDDPHINVGQINEEYIQPPLDQGNVEKHQSLSSEELSSTQENHKVKFTDLSSTPQIGTLRSMSRSNLSALASAFNYDDVGLSAELNGLLNISSLDPMMSTLFNGSIVHSIPVASTNDRRREDTSEDRLAQYQVNQYMMLEKYHSQLRSRQESIQEESPDMI